MKKIVFVILLFLFFNGKAQTFYGTMNESQFVSYISRSINMGGFINESVCWWGNCNSSNSYYDSSAYQTDLDMLADLDARIIGRTAGFWGSENMINLDYFDRVKEVVDDISYKYSAKGLVKPICEGAIFEFVTNLVNDVTISDLVASEFNVSKRKFNFDLMKFQDYPSNSTHMTAWDNPSTQIVPDITKKETQMWYYFLATKFIDAGIECISFNQVDKVGYYDVNYAIYDNLINKIKNYALSKNRGVVLISGGAAKNSRGELIFDFVRFPIRIQEVPYTNWGNGTGGKAIISKGYCNDIYSLKLSGRMKFGWHVADIYKVVEFDNYGISSNPNYTGSTCFPWGWDEITWFSLQSNSYRNDWLGYAYYKVRCLSNSCFLEMPGRRGITLKGATWPEKQYRCATGYYNQQATIKKIWNNAYPSSSDWLHHNFTDEETDVKYSFTNSSLSFSGKDKMFFVGNDGYIYGYVKEDSLSGWKAVSPSWSAVSNGQNINSHVKAKSGLVVSPDGTMILYIGVDGYIHGYKKKNAWRYSYFDFMKTEMSAQNLFAEKDICFASNNRIYYVAKENNGTGNSRVHGFIKYNGNWLTVSPSYSSPTSHKNMMTVGGALTYNSYDKRLYYVGTDGFLYYYTIINDWNYIYNVVPKSQLLSQNLRILPEKLAINKNVVFYIGKELANNNSLRVHALSNSNGNVWNTISPSWSAHINGQNINAQIEPNGKNIAVNPSGNIVSYSGGLLNHIYYYKDINNRGFDYTWHEIKANGNYYYKASNSLQFNDDKTMLFVSGIESSMPGYIFRGTYWRKNSHPHNVIPEFGDYKVHKVVFEESNCENEFINKIEPEFLFRMPVFDSLNSKNDSTKINNVTVNQEANIRNFYIENNSNKEVNGIHVKLYPNPANNEITIAVKSKNLKDLSTLEYIIYDNIGETVKQGSLTDMENKISIEELISGLYMIIVKSRNHIFLTNKLSVIK